MQTIVFFKMIVPFEENEGRRKGGGGGVLSNLKFSYNEKCA